MSESSGNRVDRYLAGELSRAEERELAQAALDDPDLFDLMTVSAVTHEALRRGERLPPGRPASRRLGRFWFVWSGLAAAAAAAIVFVATNRSASNAPAPAASTASSSSPSASSPRAPASAPENAFRPAILVARLDALAGGAAADFRIDGVVSRSPKAEGRVVSSDDGAIEIDLGSLDGIAKGSELRVRRDDSTTMATLTIVTVFRERARGRGARAIAVGDRVDVPPDLQVAALIEQTIAKIGAGDAATARATASRAASLSDSASVPSRARGRALGLLGTLEHRAGALDEAERHLRESIEASDQSSSTAMSAERIDAVNELGALLIERGDYAGAEKMLRIAEPHASGASSVRILNNLAAVAVQRHDTRAAESMYQSALVMAGRAANLESERQTIARNLEGLKSAQ
jgi:hypothetical protein